MSNIVSEFSDSQKFDPKGWDSNNNGESLVKGFDGNVLYYSGQLPSALKTVDPTSAPPDETTGNIYILFNVTGTVHAEWDGSAKNDVVYFNGSDWVAISPSAGATCYDKERNCLAKFDGSDWILDDCYAEVELDSTDLTTPNKVDLITPISSEDILDPIVMTSHAYFGTSAYTGSGAMTIYSENNGTAMFQGTSGAMTDTNDHVEKLTQKDAEEIQPGDKIQASVSSALSSGDGTVTVKIKYRIVKA